MTSAGVDFVNPSSNPIFSSGSGANTTMNIEVPIIDDNIVENAETIILTASVIGPFGSFAIGGNMATLSITNDDCECRKCGRRVEWEGGGVNRRLGVKEKLDKVRNGEIVRREERGEERREGEK